MSRWPWPMSGPRRPRLMSWPRRFRPRSRRVCMFTSGRIPRQNRLHTGPWIKRGRAPRMSSPPGRRVWPRGSTLRLNICPRRQKLSRNRSISLKGYIHGSHWPGWNLSCNVYIRNINTRSLSDRIRIDSWFLFLSCCPMSVAETVTLTLGRAVCCVFSSPGPFSGTCDRGTFLFFKRSDLCRHLWNLRQSSSSHREQTSHVWEGEQELFLQDRQTSWLSQ